MTKYVAFLRDINIPGQPMISMDDLRAWFEAIPGVSDVTTYLASGNVLFHSLNDNESLLVSEVESLLSNRVGHSVVVLLRKYDELKRIVQNNPLTTVKTEEKNRMYVTFLSDVPAFDVRGSLGVYSNDAEYARVVNREVYVYSNNYGKTCFSNTFIEKKLGLRATTRSWTMVNKLIEL
jgi:uncharacterized protein (DUF1697 family)